MVASAITSIMVIATYRLQLVNLSASSNINQRQILFNSVASLANQIHGYLPYSGLDSLSRNAKFLYHETSYSSNNSLSGHNCAERECNDKQYATYMLYQWKSNLSKLNFSKNAIAAIVCMDNGYFATNKTPTLNNHNCSGDGDLVIKVVWQSHHPQRETEMLPTYNHIILPVYRKLNEIN